MILLDLSIWTEHIQNMSNDISYFEVKLLYFVNNFFST
jgi:hypothetical protein